jgi:hypothetical protein
MLRYNTTTQALENYTNQGWAKVASKVPLLISLSGSIVNGYATSITITGSDLGQGAGIVRFTSGGTTADVAATPSGSTVSATVPSSIYNLSNGTSVVIAFVSEDNIVSSNTLSTNVVTITTSFSYTGSVGSLTAIASKYKITAYGAQGGAGSDDTPNNIAGANGGGIEAYVNTTAGETLYYLVGGAGGAQGSTRGGGGGGGFTAVWRGSSSPGSGTWLVGAGGGGGGAGRYDNSTTYQSAGAGGSATATQSSSAAGGSGGGGGGGGAGGGSGSSSGGGGGGTAPGDNSGGGGGGGFGQTAGNGSSGSTGGEGAGGGFGGGGGGGGGGSGGEPIRISGGGGGGGGYVGGNGGQHSGYGGLGGRNFYRAETVPGIGTQLVFSSAGVRSGNGALTILPA